MTEQRFTGIRFVDHHLANAEEKVNKEGNRYRQIFFSTERYLFDFKMNMEEWEQFDTDSDAWYFGVWVNKAKRRTLCYAEGDISFTQCEDDERYDAEIASMCKLHAPGKWATVVDTDVKTITDYYQDRREFFIDPERARAFFEQQEAAGEAEGQTEGET